MMNNPDIFSELSFLCKQHRKQAQAFCTEEGCQDRILCYLCIRNNHPQHEDKFENIVDLFKFPQATNKTRENINEKALQEFKTCAQTISAGYEQVTKEFFWFEHLVQLIGANSLSLVSKSDSSNEIKSGLEKLIAKSANSTVLSDSSELNGLINKFLESRHSKSVLNEKVSSLQSETTRLFDELTSKLSQFSRELVVSFELKTDKEEVFQQKKMKETKESDVKRVDSAVQTVGRSMEVEREGDISRKTPSKASEEVVKEKLSIPKNINQFKAKTTTAVAQFNSNNLPNNIGSERSVEQTVILISESDEEPPATTITPQKITKTPNKPESNVNNLHENETQKFKDDVNEFFTCGCNCKEPISVFEEWLQKAQHIPDLDKDLFLKLESQKAIIDTYNNTKPQLDFISILQDSEKFVYDLKVKIVKPSLSEFEENLETKRKLFIEESRNWLEEPKLKDLIHSMEKSRIALDQQEKELSDRLGNFHSYWELVERRIDFGSSQRIEFSEFEKIMQSLWTFGVKFPAMERVLNKYFECKGIEVAIKFFLIRSKQLESMKDDFFSENLSEAQLQALVDQLKITSLSTAQSIKKKANEVGEKISFGLEFGQFVKLIDDTEKFAKFLGDEVLNSTGMAPYKHSLIQTQMHACMHCLFFQEMIDLRQSYLTSKPTRVTELRNAPEISVTPKSSNTKQTLNRILSQDHTMCIESQGNKEIRAEDSKMIEEILEPIERPRSSKSSIIKSPIIIKPTPPSTESAMTKWLKELAQHLAQVLEARGMREKVQEVDVILANQDNFCSNLMAFVESLNKSSIPELSEYYNTKGKESLEAIIANGLSLKFPHSQICKELIVSLKTMSWRISSHKVLSAPTQTFEQLYECLSDFDSRNLGDKNKIPEAKEIEERLFRFEALKGKVQAIENADWRKIIEESRFESMVTSLELYAGIYNQLLIDDPALWRVIQENLMLINLAEKIAKQAPGKFNLHELERLAEKAERFFRPDESANNAFMLNLHLALSSVKKDTALREYYRELKLSHLNEILADLLQNKANESNFLQIIADVQSAPVRIKNLFANLSVDLEPGYLTKLDLQLQNLADVLLMGGFNFEKAETKDYAQLLESIVPEEADSLKRFVCWVTLASAALVWKKLSFKFFAKLAMVYEALSKIGIVVDDTMELFQRFFKEYKRVKSLNGELILVKGEKNGRQNPIKMSKEKPFPLNAEYLFGLKKRLEKSRIEAPRILKSICFMLKRNKDLEEQFESYLVKNKSTGKVSHRKFRKLEKKVEKSTAISKKLDDQMKETVEKRKLLFKEIKEMRSGELLPQALFEKMSNFCNKLYAQFPFSFRKCNDFLKEFEAFKLLYSYKNTSNRKEVADWQQKLDHFESVYGEDGQYKSSLLQMKKQIWRVKANRVENIRLGTSTEKHISLEEIQTLIQEWDELTEDEKNCDEPLRVLLKIFEEKISDAISEINNSMTIEQLDERYFRWLAQFQGIVKDLPPVYMARKEELKYNSMMADKPIVLSSHSEPVNKSLPLECDPSKRHLNEVKKNLFEGLNMVSQMEEEKSDTIHSKILETPCPLKNSMEKPVISNEAKVKIEEMSRMLNSVVKVGNVVIIMDSDSDNENKEPAVNQSTKSQEIEPSLSKKVKSNEGSQIVVQRSPQTSLQKPPSLVEKLRDLILNDNNIRNHRKDLMRHIPEIAEVIQDLTRGENASYTGYTEDGMIENFKGFMDEAESLKCLWGLLDKDFDKGLLKKILHCPREQRKDLEKKAEEEINKGREKNLSAGRIILQMMRNTNMARKSNPSGKYRCALFICIFIMYYT